MNHQKREVQYQETLAADHFTRDHNRSKTGLDIAKIGFF